MGSHSSESVCCVLYIPCGDALRNACILCVMGTLPVQIYVAKHARESKKGEWVSGNLVFFRMHRILDIYFVGGFGTVQWVDVADYMATKPDSIVAADPQQTISVSHCHALSSMQSLLV